MGTCSPLLLAVALACPTVTSEGIPSNPEDTTLCQFTPAPGPAFDLDARDPNVTREVDLEGPFPAVRHLEEGRVFWRLPSYPITYTRGDKGWTSRVHVHASGGVQRFSWRDGQGYISGPGDLRNAAFTVFLRVRGVLDPSRAQVTLKIRGGKHTVRHPEWASCVMMTLAPNHPVSRFGKELDHPHYDYVVLSPRFPAALPIGRWIGMRLVTWIRPEDPTQVVYHLYLDLEPFREGKRAPTWHLFSEYIDRKGQSTGRYDTLADWGGWETTLRTDGFQEIDFTGLSVREIQPPRE